MVAQLIQNPHWFWLAFGGILLAAELLGASGYLLWSGISAIIIGLLAWLIPLNWPWLWVIFSALTLMTAWLWWYWLGRYNRHHGKRNLLNQRGQQLIGLHVTLTETLHDGHGRLRVGDGTWRVEAQSDIPAGSTVEVVEVEGITLKIKKVQE